MAKQTILQLVNKVLENLGESSSLSALTSLSGLSLLTFNTFNEVLYDLSTEHTYQPLEEDGTITLASGTATYAQPTDMNMFDKDSFRYNEESRIPYYTPQRFDRQYITQTDTGIHAVVTNWKGYWKPYKIPDANADTKTIKYRYWKLHTILSTDTATATCWMPEGYDVTLLANLVTYKVLHYKNNPEAAVYYEKVYGTPRGMNEGSLAKFNAQWGSPIIADGSIMVEPM